MRVWRCKFIDHITTSPSQGFVSQQWQSTSDIRPGLWKFVLRHHSLTDRKSFSSTSIELDPTLYASGDESMSLTDHAVGRLQVLRSVCAPPTRAVLR
jgi:hypothetical protein